MHKRHAILALALALLAACGPDLGDLEKGETGVVARANAGASLFLEDDQGVLLAEIGAPRRDEPYAEAARAELEGLSVGREALLAYGGERAWSPRPREGETPRSFAIAHVFIQSEGGRWFWLQHALVLKGAAWVRPRPGNHARIAELLQAEAHARETETGLWGERAYRVLSVAKAAELARESAVNCTRAAAPYRLVEGVVTSVYRGENRAALSMEGDETFTIVAFGRGFAEWDGPAFESLQGQAIRARGPLGLYRDAPQLCLEQASGLELRG